MPALGIVHCPKFNSAGLIIKKKCFLGVDKVDFLGFTVDADGIHPAGDKNRAITKAPAPKSKVELQEFLGLLNFYHAFLPHKAVVAKPLHRLLGTKAPWTWGRREAWAFHAVKDLLISNSVLTHFDEELPVVLVCEASPYGVGVWLGHRLPNDQEVSVAYYSCTLSPAEHTYTQIDKKSLAIVTGVKKFHYYLHGCPFTILMHHKMLLGLFAPDRQMPQVLPPKVLRWSIFLAGYQYSLQYRLSCLLLPDIDPDPAPTHQVFPEQPLHAQDIAHCTGRDCILSRVLDWLWRGWPTSSVCLEFAAFASHRDELSAHKGCFLWGNRVVVPSHLCERVLSDLHETHPGIVHMKAFACSYLWWPGIDVEIETCIKRCQTYQESHPEQPQSPVQSWESTRTPWPHPHLDFSAPSEAKPS